MAAPLIVRLVMDAAGYLKTVDTAVASNTKLEQSSLGVGKAMALSADQQVAASLKATRALETQIAGQRALAVDATKSAEVRARASLLADRAQGRLNSSLGLTSVAATGTSRAVQKGEKDLGKFTRGALAGSGAASSLGRSLAFASTGFIAIAGSATIIASSIKAALSLAKTQSQVDQQLKTTGKSWNQYGQQIDTADLKLSHLSGFTNQELLQSFTTLFRVTGNVSSALNLNSLAANVARGRNITLTAASNALAKAQAGSFSALRRLNIVVPLHATRLEALAAVQEKYAGQAAAGATVADKFHAALVNTEETIGTALLPAFTRATSAITDWLAKMTESGRLQHDLNDAVTVGSAVFHTAGAIIGVVDKITGSFANTLKILIGVWLGRELVKGIIGVDKLVGSWTAVEAAANGAAAAEGRAVAGGELAGGAGVAGTVGATGENVGFLAQRAASKRAVASAAEAEAAQAEAARSEALISRVSKYTSTMVPAEQSVAAVGTAAAVSTGEVGLLSASLLGLGAITIAPIVIPIAIHWEDKFHLPGILGTRSLDPRTWLNTLGAGGAGNFFAFIHKQIQGEGAKRALEEINASAAKQQHEADVAAAKAAFGSSFFRFGQHNFVPTFQGEPGQRSVPLIPKSLQFLPGGKTAAAAGPFGAATPIAVYTKYVQTITEQIAVAQAALTKSTKDDVAAAKAIIARIKRGIARGHYEGASLVQALQDEATQQGVLNNARQAAAQQAAKIAAAKKAAASSYTTPIDLQLAEARAQLTKSTADDLRVEKQILAAAKAALASGSKNKQGQLAALQVMLQAKQAIQSLATTTASTFTQPLRLQLALAKAQALGTNQEGILLRMKAALEKALKSAKGNIQKQIDIYNQIAAINQQLGSSAGLGFGDYKQASLAAETAGLGLTKAQRKALEARLSQRGPGGTVPGSGVGAGGFIIGPDGRPIHRHRRPHHGHQGADSQAVSPARFNHLIRVLERTANRPIRVVVDLDGKIVADNTTRHQQRHKRHNSSQRRGPNAGSDN